MSQRAEWYKGYGNCKRCGDRWPILYRLNSDPAYQAPDWVPVDGWLSEEEHDKMHDSLVGRARLIAYRLARTLGFRLSNWPDEAGR